MMCVLRDKTAESSSDLSRPARSTWPRMADETEETLSTRKSKETTPGVVYMSRLPPFMKPAKIRNIFSQYGEVGRLFLQPEGNNFVKPLSSLTLSYYIQS